MRHRLRFSHRLCVVLCLGLLPPSSGTAAETAQRQTGDLVIRVTGMESGRGAVQYALYNAPDKFPTREGRIAKGAVPAAASGSTIVIKGLAPGFYAVAVYHDENLNDEFDQGLFGFPLETYGFSNNARGFFSAPDFEDAMVLVNGHKTEISIGLGR